MQSPKGVEDRMGAAKDADLRQVAFIQQQERYRQEESADEVKAQLDDGRISKDEARKLVARAKMHAQKDAGQTGHDGKRVSQVGMVGADYLSTERMLEEFLELDDHNWFKRTFGIYKIEHKAKIERARREAPEFVHPFPICHRIEQTGAFELTVVLMMTTNALLIGVQVSELNPEKEQLYANFEHAFTAFFVLEVLFRLLSNGWTWIWDKAAIFDTSLIFLTGVLPMWILPLLQLKGDSMRLFAVLRPLRLVRLVFRVRTFPMFRIFWTLIRGLAYSGRTLLWTYVIITLVLYVLAIFGVYLIGKGDAFKGDAHAAEYFGDVPKAWITLFQTATLDSWASVARPLMRKSGWVAPFFVLVIMIVTLALLNLVTAVIVNNAFETAQQDTELRLAKMKEAKENEIKELTALFYEIDEDGSGMISKEEYDYAVLHNESVLSKFGCLEIAPKEYEDIWHLLDDGAGEVGVDHFSDCLRAMQGEAKAKDSFSIVRRVHMANQRLEKLSQRLKQHRAMASDLRAEANQVKSDLGVLLHEMCDFIQSVGDCIPDKPLHMKGSQLEMSHDRMRTQVQKLL